MIRIEKLLESLEKGICIIVTDTNLELPGPQIVYVNKNWEEATGYTLKEVFGKTPRILQGPSSDHEALALLKKTLKNNESFGGFQTINYRKDGTPIRMVWNIVSKFQGYYIAIQKVIKTDAEAEFYLEKMSRMRKNIECSFDGIIVEIPSQI